jgi:hypothetical protein
MNQKIIIFFNDFIQATFVRIRITENFKVFCMLRLASAAIVASAAASAAAHQKKEFERPKKIKKRAFRPFIKPAQITSIVIFYINRNSFMLDYK